jgi:hypothetical protein
MENHLPAHYAFRLEDLRGWHVVRVSCRTCRHKAEIAPATLMRGHPGYTRLVDREGQLRCRKCGARGRAWLRGGIMAARLKSVVWQDSRRVGRAASPHPASKFKVSRRKPPVNQPWQADRRGAEGTDDLGIRFSFNPHSPDETAILGAPAVVLG